MAAYCAKAVGWLCGALHESCSVILDTKKGGGVREGARAAAPARLTPHLLHIVHAVCGIKSGVLRLVALRRGAAATRQGAAVRVHAEIESLRVQRIGQRLPVAHGRGGHEVAVRPARHLHYAVVKVYVALRREVKSVTEGEGCWGLSSENTYVARGLQAAGVERRGGGEHVRGGRGHHHVVPGIVAHLRRHHSGQRNLAGLRTRSKDKSRSKHSEL